MLLYENSFDRKVNNYIKDYTGLKDFNQVRSFLLNKVYKTIPELRLITSPEAVQTALGWFFNPDGSQKNEDYIVPFRQILQAIKEKAPDELNKMGYAMQFMEPQSYCREYGYLVKHEKNTVPSSKTQKESTTPNGYHIRRVDSFDEAYGGGMSEWCIGRDEEWWDEMVGYTATVYLVWNKDADMDYEETYGTFTDENGEEFESTYDEYFMDMSYTNALRDPNYGRFGSGKYPYDRYGMSKLIVIAHDSGMFEVWSRYNMTDGKDGTYLTKRELSQLIGMDANKAFPFVNLNENRLRRVAVISEKLWRQISEAYAGLDDNTRQDDLATAARRNGFNYIAYHNTGNEDLTFFDVRSSGIHFGSKKAAEDRGNSRGEGRETYTNEYFLKIENPYVIERDFDWEMQSIVSDWGVDDMTSEEFSEWRDEHDAATYLGKHGFNHIVQDENGDFLYERGIDEMLADKGYDCILYKNEVEDKGNYSVAMFNPNNIKLAKQTYDDNGNPIPLEQRFDTSTDDVRY